MGFYLFKMEIFSGVNNRSYYCHHGIIVADSLAEAFEIVSSSYSEDPLGDTTINAKVTFFKGDNDDCNICYISSTEFERLKVFFDFDSEEV